MLKFLPILMVRFSEIAIKSSNTRKWLTDRLVSHINFVLKKQGIDDFEIIKEYSRIYIKSSENDRVLHLISALVPGTISVSKAFVCSSKLDEIKLCVQEKFFHKFDKNTSFSVKARRTGKHPFTSVELGAIIGEFILENNKEKELEVNLTNPDYTLFIEVRESKTYVFDETERGLGGLSVGSQGKVLVLLSGEEEDLSNIIQLYKRGAITLVYSSQKETEMKSDFKQSVIKILNLQPQLKNKEIFFVKDHFEIYSLLEYYKKNECLGLAISKKLFKKFENTIPVTVPTFVPHLASEIDKDEISRLLTTIT